MRAGAVEEARAEDVEQRVEQEQAEEGEGQDRDGQRERVAAGDGDHRRNTVMRRGSYAAAMRPRAFSSSGSTSRLATRSMAPFPIWSSMRVMAPRNSTGPRPASNTLQPGRRRFACVEQADGLGPQREGDRLALARVAHGAELLLTDADAQRLAVPSGDSAAEQVGGPHELGDEWCCRRAVDILRPCYLLELAGAHHGDTVGHGERFFLVVRDVDGRDPELLLELADLGAHLHAQLGVEVGERFVEQQDLGLDHQAAGDGDALELAARELMRPAVAIRVEMHEAQCAGHTLLDLRLGHAARLEAVGHVPPDREIGEDGVVLEHHAGVAAMRR